MITRLVSPFMGGGAVEIALAKELGIKVTAYDVFDILVNYWDVQINQPQALYEGLKKFSPTRETFASSKETTQGALAWGSQP